jgi:beta-glucosidase
MSSDLPYRDSTLSVEERVADLLSRMTLAEKAGQMFHSMIFIGAGGNFLKLTEDMIVRRP